MAASGSPSQRQYPSPYYSSPISDRNQAGYSPQFLSELEVQHERAISGVHDKLRIEQSNHDKIVEALRNQVASLRQQLDLSSKVSQAELAKARETQEERVGRSIRDKEEKLTFLAAKAADLQKQLDSEVEKNSSLRQELLSLKLKHSEEVGQLEAQVRALRQELDMIKTNSLAKAENEIQRLRSESQRREEEAQKSVSILQIEHSTTKEHLQAQLKAKDSIIQGLDSELQGLKGSIQSRKIAQERDIEVLQGTITSSKKVIGLYEQEIERLKQSREEAKKEAVTATKEAAVAEMETARLRAKNEQLESQIERMQRLLTKS